MLSSFSPLTPPESGDSTSSPNSYTESPHINSFASEQSMNIVMTGVPQPRKRAKLDRRNSHDNVFTSNSFRNSLHIMIPSPVDGSGIPSQKSNPLAGKKDNGRISSRSRLARNTKGCKGSMSASASMFHDALAQFKANGGSGTTFETEVSSIPVQLSNPCLGLNKVARAVGSPPPTMSVNSLLLPPLNPNIKNYNIAIHCLSTWEGTERVSCGEIDILDDKRQPLPVIEISTVPISENSEFIVDGNLIKKNASECWYSKMNPEKGCVITITVESSKKPSFIRLWNNQFDKQNALKSFEIFVDDNFVYKGDLDQQFGQNISLLKNIEQDKAEHDINRLIDELSPPKEVIPNNLVDRYGRYPTIPFDKLDLHVLDSYDGMNFAGLNAIQFFDVEGKRVPIPETTTVSIQGMQTQTSFSKIFSKDPADSEAVNMWTGAVLDADNAIISLDFGQKVYIAGIRIFNYNGSGENCNKGIKKMKITYKDSTLWIGGLKKGRGRRADVFEYASTIYIAPHTKKIPID